MYNDEREKHTDDQVKELADLSLESETFSGHSDSREDS